jgi:hypothetical protein
MRLGHWMVGAAAIAFAAGCNKVPLPLNSGDRAAIADSVSQVATQWLASFSAQPTVENYLSGYVRGNDLVHAEYGMIYPTYDSLVAGARAFLKPITSFKVTMGQKRVTVLDRDVVVLTAMLSGTMKDAAGTETPMQEAWTAVYNRTPDGWKIAADHESTPPPAPAAPAKPKRRSR